VGGGGTAFGLVDDCSFIAFDNFLPQINEQIRLCLQVRHNHCLIEELCREGGGVVVSILVGGGGTAFGLVVDDCSFIAFDNFLPQINERLRFCLPVRHDCCLVKELCCKGGGVVVSIVGGGGTAFGSVDNCSFEAFNNFMP
jgi:hypothetical protein